MTVITPLHRRLRIAATVIVSIAGLVGLAFLATFYYLKPTLPDVAVLRDVRLQVPLRVYSRDGKLLAQLGEQRRVPVTWEEIPEVVVQAVLAAEDDRFFRHPGVDWQGIARAVLVAATTMEASQGGSTLTQQLVRTTLITKEKQLRRKLREVFLALSLENELSKQEIFTLFVNTQFLGQRSYGFAAAAETYFGKPLSQVNAAEAALLAGILQAPSRLNPVASVVQATERRAYVLRRMRELGYLDEAAWQSAMDEPVARGLHGPRVQVEAPYIGEMVRLVLYQKFGNRIYSDGYQVVTTVDSRLQRAADIALRSAVLEYDRRHGWRGPAGHVDVRKESDEALAALIEERPVVGGLIPAIVVRTGAEEATVVARSGMRYRLGMDGIRWARTDEVTPKTPRDVLKIGDTVQLASVDQSRDALDAKKTVFDEDIIALVDDEVLRGHDRIQVKEVEVYDAVAKKMTAGYTLATGRNGCVATVLQDGRIVARIYEQTTYPEWAFSAYRTGETPDGPLPLGAGSDPQSCQDCHMPSRDADAAPIRSKIASIQEYSNFPQAEHNLGPEDIDLPVREGFSVHTLVGLNVFLVKMAQQFPDVLGIRTLDPMLGTRGVDPLIHTEQAMLDLAGSGTADLTVGDIGTDEGHLRATVTLTSKVGHKFPSGVGFRRAFLEFQVLDQNGETLWASGRTNAAGALVDEAGEPLDGEYWWEDDCSARIRPEERLHQPHYQRISSQGQAQIYQELVSTPPQGEAAPICGPGATPEGQLTTSFLSICATVKDNRILPDGFLPLADRVRIAAAFGAGEDLAEDVGATGVGDDPDYVTGGGDSLVYEVPLAELPGGSRPAAVQARLFYQATPPFYLQDRFCTARGEDAERLKFLVGHLNLDGTAVEGWKLEVVSTGPVPID